jgi:hypothetical protein
MNIEENSMNNLGNYIWRGKIEVEKQEDPFS